jgi:hypothetical protein
VSGLSRYLPFSRDAFLGVFEAYNAAIWPAQIAAYALCLAAVLLALRPLPGSGRAIAAILAAAWLWNGVAYHMLQFAQINWAAWIFGFFFVVEGMMLLATGVLRGRLAFRFTRSAAGWAGLVLIAIALVAYPLIGMFAGQPWPRLALAGVAPCPTAIVTLGLLLLAEGRVPIHLLVLPLLWALVGGAAAWLLAIPQDLALPAAALLTVILAWRKNRLNRA